jgi:ubiquinone/menaquinone biosynthesis C-methylase UbiE
MRCLDVGCGTGEVTLQMARMVGPSGKVVGMDIDEPYLEQARQEAARRRFNIVFQQGDALNLCVESTYDLVYTRYLLTHLNKPEFAVERMIKAIRPGGTIVVEDVDFPGHVCYPHCPAFERYVELYQAVVRLNGGDPTIGPRLYGLLKEVGASQLSVDISQPTFCEGEGKLVAQITMEHIRETVVSAGLASHTEIDNIVSELDAFARSPDTIMSITRVFQVWGNRSL